MKQTYKPYTLVGPIVTGPVQDPLAVTRLENRLFIHLSFAHLSSTSLFMILLFS